mgnify:CR=1
MSASRSVPIFPTHVAPTTYTKSDENRES